MVIIIVDSNYPRFLTRNFKPFDPVKLAFETEKIVSRNSERKYTAFYATGVYRGISTGYIVGCCLRCFYCWSEFSRDFPEFYGYFFSPEVAIKRIVKAAKEYGTSKARISGGEPTLCRKHLIRLLELFHQTELKLFILETNGILLGYDKSYVKELSKFERIHVRVSIKAGFPITFERRTGAIRDAFELPFKAVKYLADYGISFHVAAMTDRRIMSAKERSEIINKLSEIDKRLAENLEEEIIDPYTTTIVRLTAYGIDPYKFFSKSTSPI